MRFLVWLFIVLTLGLSALPVRAGFEDPMTFYRATTGGNCETCTWIVAEGVIEADTARAFLAFLTRSGLTEAKGINIHLNSPGGSVTGAIALGLAIRGQQGNTVVAAARVDDIYSDGTRRVGFAPQPEGECVSACVFAFAGGVVRFASTTSPAESIGFQRPGRLGVHQFYTPAALLDPTAPVFDAIDRIRDQKTIALLLTYLQEMGVSAELLQIAADTLPVDMHFLSEAELARTRIDNHMVRDFFLTGYRNGVAVAEIAYQRREADYRLELYCEEGGLRMLATVEWRGEYSVESHRKWALYENISLRNGGPVTLISEEFTRNGDGSIRGQLRFRFADPLDRLVGRKAFAFEDSTGRYANNAARALSFVLPDDFDGLYVLPSACM